jgi:putative spermidine/putrescine transport system substrate-binding protein
VEDRIMVSVPRVLTAAAVLLGALQTTAQAKELVVAIFGGSFLDNTKACHGAPFEKRTGAKVNFVLGNSVQNVAKLRAAQGRSEVDVAYMDLQIVQQAKAEGLLQKVNAELVPNLKDLYPSAKDPDLNWIGMMYSGTTIAYNPKTIKDPPQSWGDFWNPAYKGKVALADITATFGQHFLLAASRLRGGSMDNTDPGFAALKELHPNVVTYYTQADQLVSLLERGDIAIAPWSVDRIGAAAAKGVPVAVSFPKEGAVGILPTVSVPKGAGNADLAHAYIDVLLSPEAQICFAEKQYAGPTNKNVKLPDELAKAVPYGKIVDSMYFPDTAALAKNLPKWTERWGREIVR